MTDRLRSRLLRRRAAPLLLAALAVAAAVVVVAWTALTGDAPEPLQVDERATGAVVAPADLIGSWTAVGGTQAGYRIREELASLPARSDAVGRTRQVEARLRVVEREGELAVGRGAEVVVDMTSLRSDSDRRDRRLRTDGLETARFPTATFRSSEDAPIPAGVLRGEVTQVLVRGELTLHGVTRAFAFPMDARVRADRSVEVVGELPLVLGDFGIRPPSIVGFVTVEPEGRLEFRLVLRRARG